MYIEKAQRKRERERERDRERKREERREQNMRKCSVKETEVNKGIQNFMSE